ncbi:putative mediator of RNA polymerase II transcription subunit 12 [Microplitis demolitor]|uniref:putative mediator of RNA polymerase II transcription subunit 12 n=1 Tax=Microplitis demolitor TaxID=69319 RepID=UPI00235B6305|nr:putative mediator of RNA polymerase II transcription subunit 12 [Microplitis demolitor]
MDIFIDDVLNDQLDIDELLEEAEQQQDQEQQQCRQQPAAPLTYEGKPLWHTRKQPPSPEISASESESTSIYDAEAESLSALEHIRQQQSMEIERIQQLQQQ